MRSEKLKDEDIDLYECPICKGLYRRHDMYYSRDCHGIIFRLLCHDCLSDVYELRGYDGEYYDDSMEVIDEY